MLITTKVTSNFTKVSDIIVNIVQNHCARKHTLQYHLSIHTGQYRFKCDKCGQGFNSGAVFQKHTESHI